MQLLRARDRTPRPWKNGGGITYEIAVVPRESDFSNFLWRLSIAEVTEAGPFSNFEDIDRVFAVLSGSIALTFANQTIEVGAKSDPIVFAGEASCFATPMKGAVTDLNLMLRRDKVRGQMRRMSGRMMTPSATTIVVAPEAQSLRIDGKAVALQRHDAIRLDGPCDVDLDGDALVITIA